MLPRPTNIFPLDELYMACWVVGRSSIKADASSLQLGYRRMQAICSSHVQGGQSWLFEGDAIVNIISFDQQVH